MPGGNAYRVRAGSIPPSFGGRNPLKRIQIVAIALVVGAFLFLAVLLGSGVFNPKPTPTYTRADAIPASAVKMTPTTDTFPPILRSGEWEAPVPMPGPVNTAGAEDSPFITPDGDTFLFFFTPDVRVPAEKQLLDHVTGIWYSSRSGGNWTEPSRVVTNNDVALDGCPFLQGSTLWFCSARAGNYRGVDLYTAQFSQGTVSSVMNAGAQLNQDYKAGEMALSPDGQTLYWGSGDFSAGTNVLYASNRTATGWDAPYRLANVNNVSNAFLPFVSPNGTELWFTAPSGQGNPGPAIYRSLREGANWGTPVEIVSQFAGEPMLDSQGNLYFVHHYFRANMTMIEADIYVAYHKGVAAASMAPSSSSPAVPGSVMWASPQERWVVGP